MKNEKEIRANAIAEGRVHEVYDAWSGIWVEEALLNEEEKAEIAEIWKAEKAEFEAKVEAEKAERLAKEKAKAEANGMSLEEWKKAKAEKAKKARRINRIKAIEEAIAKLEAEKRELEELVKEEG